MFPERGALRPNRYARIPFTVTGADVAAGSQGTNLTREKVDLAVRQAFGLWTAVAPINFTAPLAGEEVLLRLTFASDMRGSLLDVGHTSGFISRSPTGPVGGASITVECDNLLYVDFWQEPVTIAVHGGPFDLVGVLGHEVGHALGVEHPPKDPATGRETEPALMSASLGTALARQLYPYDVREVQRLHGTLHTSGVAQARLEDTAHLIDAPPGVTLQRGSFGLVVAGPMGARAFLDVLVPARGSSVNALRLKFTTVTANVYVNRVETYDGIVPLQQFSAGSRSAGSEGLAGKSWSLQFGFVDRPQLANDMIVRLALVFTQLHGQPQSDFGVVQVEEISVETLPAPIVVHR